MTLSAGMVALSQMNVSHVIFFERRNAFEQATLSLAQALAGQIVENSAAWWGAAPNAVVKGTLNVNFAGRPDIPKMKFTYNVSPDKSNAYILLVRGEYMNPSFKDAIWKVSLDVRPGSPKKPILWSKPVQLDG